MSGCMASAWMALLSIAKMNCLMMMLGLQCCLLCRDVCAACFWADVCGLTFGSVGERGSFGRYLRELPAPLVAMGQCLVALLVLGWHCCPLQTHDGLGGFLATWVLWMLPPAPLVAMGRCLAAWLVLGWHCCLLQK